MITRENLKEVLELLPSDSIEECCNGCKEYVKLILHVSNIGSYATLEETDYDELEEHETIESGDVYCSKDDFLTILQEQNIIIIRK